jgi:hypothetical protein
MQMALAYARIGDKSPLIPGRRLGWFEAFGWRLSYRVVKPSYAPHWISFGLTHVMVFGHWIVALEQP